MRGIYFSATAIGTAFINKPDIRSRRLPAMIVVWKTRTLDEAASPAME